MPTYLYAACDGGFLNTLAGGGGVVEVMLEPEFRTRYFEFPDGMGGSTHFVLATPKKDALVASSANIGQIFVFPRQGDGFDLENYRVLNHFNSLGPPDKGTDAQTAMFDFWDNESIVVQYNRKLVKVGLYDGSLEVLADFGAAHGERADILHQVSVSDEFIVVDEVVKGGIHVYARRSKETFFLGDGFPGGHHLLYEEGGDTMVLRPAFGFQSKDAHLKIDDNTISIYNLNRRTAKTFYYSWELPNHFPTDMYKEGDFLYVSIAVPGSVCKFDLRTGRIVARFAKRPDIFTRYLSMLLDGLYFLVDYGTMRNRHDTAVSNLNQFAHAFVMGRAAGTRAGFFAMGYDPESPNLHVCHRGLNRVFCLRKTDLHCLWSRPLPSRGMHAPMVGFFYRLFPYFRRCLGVHHGTLVKL
jgi:hypothetical protein